MADGDSGLNPNCPRCGRVMTFIASAASQPHGAVDTHIYNCSMYGRWQLSPDGPVQPRPETVH
jgi:hypothetical protein